LVDVTQDEKYRQYAQQAQEQLERAPADDDRAAWLLIAQNWLNLLVQNEPKAKSSSR